MGDSVAEVAPPAHGRSLRRPVFVLLVGKAAEAATLALLVTVVPRTLGPSDYGTYGLALALVAIGVTASSLGGPGLIGLIAGASSDERAAVLRVLTARAVRWRGLWAVSIAVASAVLVLADPGRFRLEATLLVVLAIALDVGATLAFQLVVALDKTVWWSFRFPIQNVVLVVATITLYHRYGIDGALTAIVLSSGAACVVGAAIVIPAVRSAPARGEVPHGASRFVRLQWLSGLLTLMTHRGGVVIVALLAGSRVETGYAALAVGVAVALVYVGLQIYLVSLPRLSQLAREASESADAALRHLAWVTLATLGPVALLGAVVNGRGLTRFVGAEFAGAKTAIALGIAVAPLSALTGSTGAASVIQLRPEARVWATTVGALVFGIAAVALIPTLGAAGATTALLAGTAATSVVGLFFFPALRDASLVVACVATSLAILALGLDL